MVPAVILGAAVLLVLSVASDGSRVLESLRSFRALYLAPALFLATVNYVIRFGRWQLYLRTLGLRVSTATSAGVFFSGLSMAVTPGKLGELVKCIMLRDGEGVPPTLTAPAVIAERFTDLVAILMLVALGVVAFPSVQLLLIVGSLVAAAAFVVLMTSGRVIDMVGELLSRSILRGRSEGWAAESSSAFRTLLTGRTLFGGLALGLIAWFAECLAFWFVLTGFGGGPTLFEATSIYAVATLAGALSMLPGGLGATEASMAGLLVAVGVPLSISSSATLVIRACTLWWGELVGLIFYVGHTTSVRGALFELSTADDESSRHDM